jgi:hypothetical protein
VASEAEIKKRLYKRAIRTAIRAKAALDIATKDAVTRKMEFDTARKREELKQAVNMHKAAAYMEVKRAASEERSAKARANAAELSRKTYKKQRQRMRTEARRAQVLAHAAAADKAVAIREVRAAALIKQGHGGLPARLDGRATQREAKALENARRVTPAAARRILHPRQQTRREARRTLHPKHNKNVPALQNRADKEVVAKISKRRLAALRARAAAKGRAEIAPKLLREVKQEQAIAAHAAGAAADAVKAAQAAAVKGGPAAKKSEAHARNVVRAAQIKAREAYDEYRTLVGETKGKQPPSANKIAAGAVKSFKPSQKHAEDAIMPETSKMIARDAVSSWLKGIVPGA